MPVAKRTTDDLPQMTMLEVGQTCALINQYLRETSSLNEVADKLGWTIKALTQFRSDYASLINFDHALASKDVYIDAPGPVIPPSQLDIIIGPQDGDIFSSTPSDEELALAVERADANMKEGIEAMGLSSKDAEEFLALQKFNRGHFRESMEAVSSNGMRTSLRAGAQQKIIVNRLECVRAEIEKYGGIGSDERDQWIREEKMLMAQFLEIGDLINRIQDTWFKGTAVLAVANMRARDRGLRGNSEPDITQRNNKPSFRAQ